jgi:hypothetical protein
VVSGKCANLGRSPVDPDPRAQLEGVTFDPALELLIPIVGEPDWPVGIEHRRQCDIQHEWRVVAPTEAAAHISELRIDARGLEGGARLAQHERD